MIRNGQRRASARWKGRQCRCWVRFSTLTLAGIFYLILPKIVFFGRHNSANKHTKAFSFMSEKELEALADESTNEQAGQYTRKQYLSDFRKQEKHFEEFQLAGGPDWNGECSAVVPKFAFATDGSVEDKDSELVLLISRKWVFKYNNFIRYSHMAMLELWGTTLVAAWQAAPAPRNLLSKTDGSKEIVVEGLQDQRILYSVSRDMGHTWEAPFGVQLSDAVPTSERGAVWSPVLHASHDGRLWLFYSYSRICHKSVNKETTWSPGGDIRAAMLRNIKSLQPGLFESSDIPSWSLPRVLHSQQSGDGLPKVVANKLVVLSSGEWVLPFWSEKPDLDSYSCSRGKSEMGSAGVLLSADGASPHS
mmetsp:Transcript_28587/g.68135  ORF Transcript_28587/g.68135 Transcript_28587/m.68135 type:complete len:362 (-) Transcript_28587:262-1347(-)